MGFGVLVACGPPTPDVGEATGGIVGHVRGRLFDVTLPWAFRAAIEND